MEIKDMTMEDIEARMAEISKLLDQPEANLEELEQEVRNLKARKNELLNQKERREKLMADVQTNGIVTRTFPAAATEKKEYNAASPEYRTAWLKNLAVDAKGKHMFGDLTAEERAAFTFTTANTGQVVPTEIMNRIVTLIDNDSPMYDDAMKYNFVYAFEVPRLKSIDAGDAKVVTEGTANDDEQDTFDNITLTGQEIKKHLVLSRKMMFQSIDAFEEWVVVHLAERIRVAKENYIIEQLDDPTSGIATANVLTTSTALTDANIRQALSQLRGSGTRVLYANADFIWNTLAGLEDETGDKLFIPSAMDDPVVEGRIYGTLIKRDSNIPDDTFYVGYPNKIMANEFTLFDITTQIEAKTLNRIYVGYSLFDAALEDPNAFVKYTVTAG